jgi:predicted metal-dependent HD superfamily phosphohydrolase
MHAPDPVQRCWDDLTSRRGCAAAPAAGAVFEEIAGAYREMHRHYHTLDHIGALLALLARFGGGAADRDALTLAVLFHDIVYDPRRQDNEEASASLAAERLAGLGFPGALVAKVARYILATRHDQPVEEIGDPDLVLLLDLDLSILAAAPDAYRAYAQAVRREYAFVPDPLYRKGRARVLEAFLARRHIYGTERLRALWEQPARANLAGEVAELA